MDLHDLPDDDAGLAETIHQRHKYVEHREREREHRKPCRLVIDCIAHTWNGDAISGEEILALAGRGHEYEALHIGHEADVLIRADDAVSLRSETVQHFRTRLRETST